MGDSETEVSAAEPRRWWVAGLLVILGFGAGGYLYVGQLRRALVAAVICLAIGIAVATRFGGAVDNPIALLALLVLQTVILLVFAVDAGRIAHAEADYRPRPYNQAWVYAAVVVVSVALQWFVLTPGIASFEVSSVSMAPTLIKGDRVLVDTRARTPKRGALVAMATPADPQVTYLRRVIAVPGDRVQIVNGFVQLNGVPATLAKLDASGGGAVYRETLPDGASHLILAAQPGGPGDNTKVYEMAPGTYFLLGDNRDSAVDSRMPDVGAVPAANIIGSVTGIFWSPERSRIGMKLE